jgi:hypothetical protein
VQNDFSSSLATISLHNNETKHKFVCQDGVSPSSNLSISWSLDLTFESLHMTCEQVRHTHKSVPKNDEVSLLSFSVIINYRRDREREKVSQLLLDDNNKNTEETQSPR